VNGKVEKRSKAMSESDYQRLVEYVLQNAAQPMIATDTGIEAAQEEIEWALAGGLAMHLYGSPRLTKDVDIIASAHLSLRVTSCDAGVTGDVAEFSPLM
jgi:hypothetical protein